MYQINITSKNGNIHNISTNTKAEALRIAKSAVKAGAESVIAKNIRNGKMVMDYNKPQYGHRETSKYMISVSSLAKSGVGRNHEYLFTDTLEQAMALTETLKATPNTSILIYDDCGSYKSNLVFEYEN